MKRTEGGVTYGSTTHAQSYSAAASTADGIGEDNKPIIRSRSFSNVKTDAVDEDVYAVAQSLAGLAAPLLAVQRIDTNALDEF